MYDANDSIRNEQKKLIRAKVPFDIDDPSVPPTSLDDVKELLDVPEPNPEKPKLGLRERWYFKRLYDKYNTDYETMARDYKLNTNQFTATQLQKKINLYIDTYKTTCDEKVQRMAKRKQRLEKMNIEKTSFSYQSSLCFLIWGRRG